MYYHYLNTPGTKREVTNMLRPILSIVGHAVVDVIVTVITHK